MFLISRNGLIINNLTAIAAGLLMGLAKPLGVYELLFIGRFCLGINAGLNSGLAPMYLTEISPIQLRGAVGTIFQLFVTIGISISQILGLTNVLGNQAQWPLLLGFPVLPAVLQLILMPLSPQSPRYVFLDRRNESKAEK